MVVVGVIKIDVGVTDFVVVFGFVVGVVGKLVLVVSFAVGVVNEDAFVVSFVV